MNAVMRPRHHIIETSVTLRGCSVDCSYWLDGCYLPATETDPAEKPSVILVGISAGGVDVMALVSEDVREQIAQRIEESL